MSLEKFHGGDYGTTKRFNILVKEINTGSEAMSRNSRTLEAMRKELDAIKIVLKWYRVAGILLSVGLMLSCVGILILASMIGG